MAENSLGYEEALEVLRATLDADAFELASGALQKQLEAREQQAELERCYSEMAKMVAGYEYIFIKEGYAHTDGPLMQASFEYLSLAKPQDVPDELDAATRLYAAYCLVSTPYIFEDMGDDKSADEFLQESGVNTEKLLELLQGYETEMAGEHAQEVPDIETAIVEELYYGESYGEFLPYPQLLEKIKEGLFQQGYERLYEQVKYREEED